MSSELVKVVIKEPNKEPEVMVIPNDYQLFHKTVGGYIEAVRLPVDNSIYIICNEEGKLRGLQPNFMLREYRDIVVGTAVFVGDDGKDDFQSLTDEQIETIKKYLQ